MNTMNAILMRRSMRAYKAQPVPDNVLTDILDAGLHGLSAENLQPWFFLLQSKARSKCNAPRSFSDTSAIAGTLIGGGENKATEPCIASI